MADNILSGLTESVQWNELADRMADGARLIDVRTPGEFNAGHVDGAINIPVDDLRERFAEIPKENVIVTCQVGQRGHTASTLLRELGIKAANLDGGYKTWSNSPAAALEPVRA
jgi:rhodanese-related sulfurtransferase